MPTRRPLPLAFAISTALFSLLVFTAALGQAGQVRLSWNAPTTDEDGTPLTDLAGYKLYYGQNSRQASGTYQFVVDVGKQTSYTLSSLADGQLYYFAVTAYDTSQNESNYSNEVTYRPAQSDVHFAINAGGSQYIDAEGIVYQADTDFSGGSIYKTTAAIGGTTDDPLYQNERYGNFSYAIPVANGDYVVTLKFAELYWTQVGQRIFNVGIEGIKVISKLDLVAQVGPKVAYDVSVPIHVTGGVLNISFQSVVNNAKVNAITVEPAKAIFEVNAGGSQYIDATGTIYQADAKFSGGKTYKTTTAIADTTDDPLYQSERYGNFSYAFPVANGNYVVTLKFAELYWTQVGKRVFNVSIEGIKVISKLDLVAKVGPKVAYDVSVPVQVADGVLNISFQSVVDNAKVSAIVVMEKGSTP